jgi:hypothetical protein
MNFLNVIYHQYFLFYRKVIKDPEPHFATVLALSFSQSLLINGIMDIIALKWFCYEIKVWVQFAILLLLIYCNYLIYHRTGKANEIVKVKPLIGNSKGLSIFITWLFFFITVSWLFWGGIYGKYLLNQCK